MFSRCKEFGVGKASVRLNIGNILQRMSSEGSKRAATVNPVTPTPATSISSSPTTTILDTREIVQSPEAIEDLPSPVPQKTPSRSKSRPKQQTRSGSKEGQSRDAESEYPTTWSGLVLTGLSMLVNDYHGPPSENLSAKKGGHAIRSGDAHRGPARTASTTSPHSTPRCRESASGASRNPRESGKQTHKSTASLVTPLSRKDMKDTVLREREASRKKHSAQHPITKVLPVSSRQEQSERGQSKARGTTGLSKKHLLEMVASSVMASITAEDIQKLAIGSADERVVTAHLRKKRDSLETTRMHKPRSMSETPRLHHSSDDNPHNPSHGPEYRSRATTTNALPLFHPDAHQTPTSAISASPKSPALTIPRPAPRTAKTAEKIKAIQRAAFQEATAVMHEVVPISPYPRRVVAIASPAL